MEYFPIFLQLRDRPCLVVGGGETAFLKTELLRKAGARVTVAAPTLEASLAGLLASGEIHHHVGPFEPGLLADKTLVIAAGDDANANRWVAEQARRANIPVNVVDDPPACSFIVPSIVDRDPITIAIGSGGTAPVLIRRLRERLETLIPASFGRLAALAGGFRQQVKQRLPFPRRRPFWEQVLDGPVAEAVFAGRETEAEGLLQDALDRAARDAEQPLQGEVYLVGAGPGDADLLTFRALRLMQQADVVLYDRLVSPAVLDLVRRDAEKINVGKARDHHTLPQDGINALMVDLASQGKRVCRLKGGDPFVFGRGGEELEVLADAGIPFQVVPGITASTGCGAFAGIPLTHRDHAQSVTFITGHRKANGELTLDWEQLARPAQTVVFYMGLQQLPLISRSLQLHGAPADRPAAIVENGTTRQQRVVTGTLSTLPALAEKAAIGSPALIIVGDVVKLREKLAWFGESDGEQIPARRVAAGARG